MTGEEEEGREAEEAMEQEEEEDKLEQEDGEGGREKEEGYEEAGFEMSEEEEEEEESDRDAERDEKEDEGKDREKKEGSHTLPVTNGPHSTVGHEIGEQSAATLATNLRLRVRTTTEDPRNNTHLCPNGAESHTPHRQRVPPSSRQWLLELTLILLTATLLVMACTRLSREWLDRVCLLSPEKPI